MAEKPTVNKAKTPTKQQSPAKAPSQKSLEKAAQEQQAQAAAASLIGANPDIAAATGLIQQNQRDIWIGSQIGSFLEGLKPNTQFKPYPNTFLSEQAMSRFAATPDRIKEWQDKLTAFQRAMGRNAYYVPGKFDPNTRADTAQVFAYMYDTGETDAWKMIDQMTQSAAVNDLGGTGNQVPIYRPSPEAQIHIMVNKAFLNSTGRLPTQKELQDHTNAYREMEETNYEAEVAATENPDQRMTVPDLPSAEQQALSGLEGTPEAMGYRARGYAQALSDLIARGRV